MKYSDGNIAELRDLIAIDIKYRGLVIAYIGKGEFLKEYVNHDFSVLDKGIIVFTDFGGLIYYPDDYREHIILVERNSSKHPIKYSRNL